MNTFAIGSLPVHFSVAKLFNFRWQYTYGRDIRCQKQPPLVRNSSSKARRTADSTDCGQPTAAPDASSVRGTAPARM